jgi:glycosyltransferase involved in cell wall biosynthesis
VAFTSVRDQEAAAAALPGLSSVVVPNAVDLEFFKPSPQDPAPDGQTVLFFGAINYYPNQDGILFFLQEVWPRIEKTHPRARLKIVGHKPPPAILAARGPRVEITGFVEDLRPHLSAAAALIVPLRIGSGTRLKIVEGMAMAKACVSTTLGAEGLDVAHERELLIADDAAGFAAQVGRLLDDPQLASRLGAAARSLVQGRYGWEAAAVELERFYQRLVEQRGESGRRGHT